MDRGAAIDATARAILLAQMAASIAGGMWPHIDDDAKIPDKAIEIAEGILEKVGL